MVKMPEPIGSISRSRAGDESIFFVPAYDFYVTDGMEVIPVEQAEAYAAERVREALEQAAQELERRRNLLINQNVVLDIKEGVAIYDLCAGAIRALITKEQ